ncbi:MAG: mechanosensitive ion channel family protein [Fusobacteriaceae bacterium]
MENVILNTFKNQIISILPKIVIRGVLLLVILFFAKKILNLILSAYKKTAKAKGIDPLLESFLSSLINTIYYIGVAFLVIGIIGIQATSVATLLGAAGLAVGLALQGSLSNLAGGILILFFRPFNKGDFISNNSGIDGSVEKIRILYTELLTVDNKSIIVPNGVLANNPVINFSKNAERRVDLIFSVSYDTSIEKAISLMEEVANNHPKINQEKEKKIRLFKHNASSLDFVYRVWCKKEDYFDVMFDSNELVKIIFDKNGIEIPYQKIDIYKKENS